MKEVLRYDSGPRGFKRVAVFLVILAGGLLIFGVGFLWFAMDQMP